MPLLNINCVLDVGAHSGQYGRFLRGLGYNGRIVSFEPVAANFASLARRCARDPCWTAHPVALGDREETLSMNVTQITQFSSFLSPNRYGQGELGECIAVDHRELVPMKRLDSLFSECLAGIVEPRVYLKMDTQGYDLRVLDGVGAYVNEIIGLQSELSVQPIYADMPGYLEALARMSFLGFEVTGLFPVDRDRQLRIIEFDCVMIRRHGGD